MSAGTSFASTFMPCSRHPRDRLHLTRSTIPGLLSAPIGSWTGRDWLEPRLDLFVYALKSAPVRYILLKNQARNAYLLAWRQTVSV